MLILRSVRNTEADYVGKMQGFFMFNLIEHLTIRGLQRTKIDGTYNYHCIWSVLGATAPEGHGLLIHEVSRSHTMTHHSR